MILDSDDVCSILAPVTITSAMIVSSSLPAEDSAALWNSGTTYTVGQRVYLSATHRVYEATGMSGNVGKDPSVPANQYDAAGVATYWIDAGPTNLFAMFDTVVSTQTVGASPLTVTLRPGYFNGFALFGLDADRVHITVRDAPGGNVIYDYEAPLEASAPADYYEYFFDRFKPQTQFIASGIDPYSDAEITLTLTKVTGDAKIGMFAIGDMRPLGVPQRDASVEPQDFSSVIVDAFGNNKIKKRNNATGLVISAKMPIEDANSVLDTVKELLGVPVVVVGSTAEMYEALTVFGLVSAQLRYADFEMPTLYINVKGII